METKVETKFIKDQKSSAVTRIAAVDKNISIPRTNEEEAIMAEKNNSKRQIEARRKTKQDETRGISHTLPSYSRV